MFRFLIVLFSIGSVPYLVSSSDICWFVRNNPTGAYTPGTENMIDVSSTHKVTGIITILGEYFSPGYVSPENKDGEWKQDYLRFITNRDPMIQMLVFNIKRSGAIEIYGAYNRRAIVGVTAGYRYTNKCWLK